MIKDNLLLDKTFVNLVQDFSQYLSGVKNQFDDFDSKYQTNKDRQDFMKNKKLGIFKTLDCYFEKVWKIVDNFNSKDEYLLHQKYYQKHILPLIEEPSEVNRQIYRKPLGYPGDYVVMNYIYDYSGSNKFLGETSYGKLINNYTCNVPFSVSNIIRKDFFKKKIEELVSKNSGVKILSVGSGPAKELLELLEEGRLNNKVNFTCLDLEKRVLDYVKEKVTGLDNKSKELLNIQYFHNNVIELIRNKELHDLVRGQNFIYASGLFDYLKDRFAKRLIKELFQLLEKEGILIICNASAENYTHRAYYEFLGEWNMFHRNKADLLSWTKDFADASEVEFDNPTDYTSYLFLKIKKIQ
jgi:SAM-dependent methyltransferase